jgi:hypothetical protein
MPKPSPRRNPKLNESKNTGKRSYGGDKKRKKKKKRRVPKTRTRRLRKRGYGRPSRMRI